MGNLYLVFESNRYVIYYNNGSDIIREEFYSIEDVMVKYGNKYTELANTDSRIQEIRSKYVEQQLGDGFLVNMPDPLDDDKICTTIMDKLFKNEILDIRGLRLFEDKKYEHVPSTSEIEEKELVKLLKTILDNYDKLKDKYADLKKEQVKELLAIKDDEKKLLEVVRKMQRLDVVYTKTALDPMLKANIDLFNLYDNLLNFRSEHTGAYNTKEYRQAYNERIYLNCHNENVLVSFMSLYAQECIKKGIQYDCKGMFRSSEKAADTTILYGTFEDIKIRLKIIEDIMNKHPEWRESFEPPVYGTSKVGTGFYGVSNGGLKMNTYNDYFQYLCKIARNSLLAEIIIKKGYIKQEDKYYDQLVKLASLKGLTPSELSVGRMKIDDVQLNWMEEVTDKYLDNKDIQRELMKTTPDEFKSRVKLVHAYCQGLNPELGLSPAISKGMYDHFGYDQKKATKKVIEIPTEKEEIKPKKSQPKNSTPPKNRVYRIMNNAQTLGNEKVAALLKEVYQQISTLDEELIDDSIIQMVDKLVEDYSTYKDGEKFAILKERGLVSLKQTAMELKELINSKKHNKSPDLNNDGFITIEEVVIDLSRKAMKYILTSHDVIEKKAMMRVHQELEATIKRKKYDIELIEKIKDTFTEYEIVSKNRTTVEKHIKLSKMDSLIVQLGTLNKEGRGEEITKTSYKQAAVDLYFNFYNDYKGILLRLNEKGFGENLPNELHEYNALGLQSFERMKKIKTENFDIYQFELFRSIIQSLSQAVYQLAISILNGLKVNNENHDKVIEVVEKYKKI